ncbi:MAG: peroxiredoxin-like family protein [Allomuricauda sp.]
MKTLSEELRDFSNEMSKNIPSEALTTIISEIDKLSKSGIVENALNVGDKVPDFELEDSYGNVISLDSMVALGPAVISFNRGNWCPFCNIDFKHLQKNVAAIEKSGSNLFVISPQLKEKSAQLKEENGYEYPILHDSHNKVAKQFGICFTLSDELKTIHKSFGMDISGHNGEATFELPIPATYVVNQNKEIVYAYINPNWMERAQIEDVKKVIYKLTLQCDLYRYANTNGR